MRNKIRFIVYEYFSVRQYVPDNSGVVKGRGGMEIKGTKTQSMKVKKNESSTICRVTGLDRSTDHTIYFKITLSIRVQTPTKV